MQVFNLCCHSFSNSYLARQYLLNTKHNPSNASAILLAALLALLFVLPFLSVLHLTSSDVSQHYHQSLVKLLYQFDHILYIMHVHMYLIIVLLTIIFVFLCIKRNKLISYYLHLGFFLHACTMYN